MKISDSTEAAERGRITQRALQVISFDEAAKRAGVTRRTIERQISLGKGPPVIKLTDYKVGILESDFNDWLFSLRQPVPSGETARPVTGNAAKTRKARKAAEGSSIEA